MTDPALTPALDALMAGDLTQARRLLRPLAEAGSAQAAWWLSRTLWSNTAERMVWLRRAADLGLGDALLELAELYEHGGPIRRDPDAARAAYQAAAQAGLAEAQFVLGSLLASGAMFEPDAQASHFWTRRAAEQGHEGAMLNLAHKCLQAGARDEAALWARRAAVSQESEIAAWADDLLAQLGGYLR